MKKIAMSLATIAMVATMSIGATGAYFSDQASVKGINFNSGNANLVIYGQNDDDVNITDVVSNWPKTLYPGASDWGVVELSNKRTANIALNVSGQLTEATGWNSSRLKEAVEIKITNANNSVTLVDYHNLVWWNAADRNLNLQIPQNTDATVRMYIRVRTNYASDGVEVGNEVANMSLTNVKFVLTGAQAH
jgi:hypothetical protein